MLQSAGTNTRLVSCYSLKQYGMVPGMHSPTTLVNTISEVQLTMAAETIKSMQHHVQLL